MITVVGAMCSGGGVGYKGKLPWYNKADLIHFRKVTLGKIVLVGRKTFEDMPKLKGREIIVLSRDPEKGISLDEFMKTGKDAMLIGGPEVWEYAFKKDYIDRVMLTYLYIDAVCDTFFPIKYLCPFCIVDTENLDNIATVVTYKRKMI